LPPSALLLPWVRVGQPADRERIGPSRLPIEYYRTLAELEGEAPGAVDVNRVARRIEAVQGMALEALKVHVLGYGRHVQRIKANQNAPLIRASILERRRSQSAAPLLMNNRFISFTCNAMQDTIN
jgi:hypothetical protein